MLCFCFRLLLKSSTKSARRKDKWNFIRKYKTEFSDQSIWKSYNEEHIIIIITPSTFENMFSYILKAQKFAEPLFQKKKNCGKSA